MNRYVIRLEDGATEYVTSDGFEPHPSSVYVFYTLAPDHTPKGAPVMVASYAIADVKSVRLSEPPADESIDVLVTNQIDPAVNGMYRMPAAAWLNKDTPNTDRPVDIP
jgi:hypothetical protein